MSTDPRWRRIAGSWVALSWAVFAVAMLAFALDQRDIADFFRSLVLPGQQPPNTSSFDATSQGALMEASVALVMGVAAWFLRGRPFFAISAALSVVALGTAVWIAVQPRPRLGPVEIGPFDVSMELVRAALALGAVSCMAASIVGWYASPPQPRLVRDHMPPPTHQG